MEKKNKPAVAVIGTGNIGKIVAANLVNSNRPVIVAARNIENAKALAAELGDRAQPMETGAAIQAADIIVFAVWFDTIKELLYRYEANLKGKIIIDPSNPIAPDGKGGFVKKIGEKESAGQILSALLPKDVTFVKALGSLSAASLANAAFQKPGQAVLFYATVDTDVNETMEDLIHDIGFDPLRVGGIEQSIRIEAFGDLHEFGDLGKTVTVSEAKEKLYATTID